MFEPFFYLLKSRGLPVSLNEWMTLTEALDKGLGGSSFTGFYYLCRSILVKTESNFDKFDAAFLDYFKDVPFPGEIPPEFLKWLSRPQVKTTEINHKRSAWLEDLTLERMEEMLKERLTQQKKEHNKGKFWVGTRGVSPFGHNGAAPVGIRVAGEGRHGGAMAVAGQRRYRDWSDDNTLDTRQFVMAFRLLRQYSSRIDAPKTELDINQTVRETSDNAGNLKIVYGRPRKNTVKLLLLIDSGGSMEYYSRLCSMLFQAATKSNHFKDLKVYYFHNCVYARLYTDPTLDPTKFIKTERVLKNISSDYKVILMGDAFMSLDELDFRSYYSYDAGENSSGLEWLRRIKKRYPHSVWLNPSFHSLINIKSESRRAIEREFKMYPLSQQGLAAGLKKLLRD
ncbi:MAG: VWA domain-containing protein [Clostridia bacterium]|nr:VWA domain-containing protein [Clostridia bacterium]